MQRMLAVSRYRFARWLMLWAIWFVRHPKTVEQWYYLNPGKRQVVNKLIAKLHEYFDPHISQIVTELREPYIVTECPQIIVSVYSGIGHVKGRVLESEFENWYYGETDCRDDILLFCHWHWLGPRTPAPPISAEK
jgi:hypothetical protein